MTPLLEVADLQVELVTDRGVVRAVDGVGLHVGAGETVTLIGESGSGKSTTAMAVLGLLPTGTAVVTGVVRYAIDPDATPVDVLTTPKALAAVRGRGVSLIPQDPMTALSPVHTVGSQLGHAIRLRSPGLSRTQIRDRGIELLDQVHVPRPEKQWQAYPHQLSGGMLQRVLIAITLAGEPRLLVADEPTSALDVTVQAGILDLLLELQERTGIGMLLITHDLGVARLVSDRIHVMRSGVFVESGEVEQVVGNPRSDYTRKLIAAVPSLEGASA
ncbi:ABC transporter ATP-binding protein [Pseudonocardia nematodicida]|uniref:ABC transporter ATP-binding protein n=1 Tax=Pseudonocardia nematodicida TaxID=1206997 RepID=A0ABV1KIK0_9PSEU